jgi:hypothetical protein
MEVLDRAKVQDRRRRERYSVRISVDWETPKGRRSASVSDINAESCFMLSPGVVHDGQIVKVYFPLSNGKKGQFWGKILNHVFDIGFAVRFVTMTEFQESLLRRLIGSLERKRQH